MTTLGDWGRGVRVPLQLTSVGHLLYPVLLWVHYTGSCSITKSCLTLSNSMDCGPTGSSVHRISQARIWEWVAVSFSRPSQVKLLSRVRLFVITWTVAYQAPGKNTGVGCHFLLQGYFPDQGSNLLCLFTAESPGTPSIHRVDSCDNTCPPDVITRNFHPRYKVIPLIWLGHPAPWWWWIEVSERHPHVTCSFRNWT